MEQGVGQDREQGVENRKDTDIAAAGCAAAYLQVCRRARAQAVEKTLVEVNPSKVEHDPGQLAMVRLPVLLGLARFTGTDGDNLRVRGAVRSIGRNNENRHTTPVTNSQLPVA